MNSRNREKGCCEVLGLVRFFAGRKQLFSTFAL